MKLLGKWLLGITFLLVAASPVSAQPMKVFVDGKELNMTVNPIIIKDTTMVPMRDFFEGMGAQVTYFPLYGQIVGKKDSTEVAMQINHYPAFINGKQIWLSQAPKVIEGKTYVPLRFLGEAFDSEVNFNERWGIIDIRKKTATQEQIIEDEKEKALNAKVTWTINAEVGFTVEPTLDSDGNILIPNGNKLLNLTPDGKQNWQISLGDAGDLDHSMQVIGTPSIAKDGTIYVGSSDSNKKLMYERAVYKITQTGTREWHLSETSDFAGDFQKPSNVKIGSNGIVYFSVKNRLHAIYPEGKRKWTYQNGNYEFATDPVPIENDKVAFINKKVDGVFMILDREAKEDWKYRIHSGDVESLIVDKENWRAYILSQSESKYYLTALDLFERQWLWTKALSSKRVVAVDCDQESIYITSEEDIISLDKQGNQKWVSAKEKGIKCVSISAGKNLYAVTNDNKLLAMNKEGQSDWELEFKENIEFVKVLNNSILIGSSKGTLFSIKI